VYAAVIQIPQYLQIYIQSLDSELNRFWTRFNVFSSMQALTISALFLAFEQLQIHPATAQAAVMVLFLWSVTGTVIIFRSIEVQRRMVRAIISAETNLADDVSLFRAALKGTNPAQFFMLRTCFSFGVVCCVFWGGMIFLGPFAYD
jgi:hypothetical protein